MSSTDRPLQWVFSRLGPISPEIDAILAKMYKDMEDPDYDGNPAETLAQVNEMMEAHYFKNESCPYYWDLTEDPDAEGFSSITLHYLLNGAPPSCELAHDPSFSTTLKEIEDYLEKHRDSDVVEVEGKPGRWVRCKFGPAKKVEDCKPKRLGPTGTWVYE